jgi:heme-degrading monooxygenase HmoA
VTQHSAFAATPDPPYVAVIFTAEASDDDDGYAATLTSMRELAVRQPGFLGMESAGDRFEITVSYWRDESDARAWKTVAEHIAAQNLGRQRWYRDYRVRVCNVIRDYGAMQ